jgi:Ca2+-binding EF-hand superfamily protein
VHCARTCQNLISFIPDFLEFTRSHFIREQTNVEIRLKAIFVGADTDGDGNMDIDEFNAMIAITQSSLSHQQLLRMYSEMTLNSRVDCDVFVRVARVFRFCAFEVGPVCGPSL